ncbi:uncharacterized protein [Nicotiana tomentosiformis]|uniref:uncharacterized protein n=1 Tax=Nicotiana tomentosiformis TaxID=4098 RepID=UPI00388CC68C
MGRIVRTRATESGGWPPVPPVRAVRGQSHGRGRGVACITARGAHVEPLVAPSEDQVPDVFEPTGPAQAQILIMCMCLAQAVSVPAAPATSQAGRGAQTPIARTPEQLANRLQTPGVLPMVTDFSVEQVNRCSTTYMALGLSPLLREAQRQGTSVVDETGSSRSREFLNILPPALTRSKKDEDLQNFIDDVQKIFRVMYATDTEAIELGAYQLKDVANTWYETWEESRGEDAIPATWKEFAYAFLEHVLPIEVLEAKPLEFERLKQNDMSVNEYYLKFVSLAKYAPEMVRDMRARVRRFVLGLSDDLLKEEVRRQRERERDREFSKRAKSTGNFSHEGSHGGGNRQFFRKPKLGPAPSSARAPVQRSKFNKKNQNFRAAGSQSQTSVGYRGLEYPTCNTCGQNNGGNVAQSTNSAAPQSSQAQQARGATKSGNAGSGQNRLYALAGRQDTEAHGVVVIGMLTVFTFDVYALMDPGSTLSYVTPYIAKKFGIEPEKLCEPFEVSIQVGESVIARRIYRGCPVKVYHRFTIEDLVELEIVDFDVIMSMDWLESCYATVGHRTKIVSFEFPGEPVL